MIVIALLAVCALSGCATRQPPLYYWGNFQDQEYAYLQGKTSPETSIQEMEKIREQAAAKNLALPPGFHAHLAMLYGLTGRTDQFERNMLAERERFPESSVYVDFLLKKKQ
jgi:hypothetical protein